MLKKRAAPAAVLQVPAVPGEPLHIKYRPRSLSDMVGQQAVVNNLASLTNNDRLPHSFLFTGPSGTGKTTVARIIAALLECTNVVEIDAARYSGIDSMREILVGAQYVSLEANNRKVIIIDECHALSKATWQTLLKSVEEPQAHLYWIFCTTEAEKVPKTIRTRCHAYDMKPVAWDVLADYLEGVAKLEGLRIDPEFIPLAARRADGSVRQGLVFLSMLNGIVQKEHAVRLLESFEMEDGGPIMLARALVKGCRWNDARVILEMLEDVSPETIRMTVLTYTAAALKNTPNEKDAERLLAILSVFSSAPWNPSERLGPALLAVGQLTLG